MWSAVPSAVKTKTERILGARVTAARRTFGGYGPSATFVLTLETGERAFFKGVYPLSEGSGVRWSLDVEEKVYARLGDVIEPWAPAYRGSLRADGWHALVLEAVRGTKVPPWSADKARRAARSYAEFHASTLGRPLPRWLPRDGHHEFSVFWQHISADVISSGRLVELAGPARTNAEAWLSENLGRLISSESALASAPRPFALLHSDTRSDNIRLQGDVLRTFDWPFAFVGPPEFDLAAFAQSIEAEGGPPCEEVVAWYDSVLPVRRGVLMAAAAGIAGYFADRAPRPVVAGLPRLRWVQRRQLTASLRWVARLLDLREPDWLASIPA